MILIDALFIANEGGGPNLLRYLLDTIKRHHKQHAFFLLIDNRFQHDISDFEYQRTKGSLAGRYRFYISNRNRFQKVFCFANTPPPVKLRIPVVTYFHNQLLLEGKRNIGQKRYFRFYLRYLFVKLFNSNTDEYIVQTPHMVDEIVSAGLKSSEHCKVFPFYKIPYNEAVPFDERSNEFVYVSAASFYKNHNNLLTAWEYLFNAGINPVLHLTVSPADKGVYHQIQELQKKGIKVINHGYTDPAPLYRRCAYMIYPSLNESFGLSLVEGAKSGMKIIAADLPYVRSVIKASAYFDPLNVFDIANAVAKAIESELPYPEIKVKDEVDNLIGYILN